MRVAIDAGGTFTDVAVIDDSGQLSSVKVLSHPDDPAKGMLHALDQSVEVRRASTIVNGTTAGLNAVLSRTGARVLVITTAGFLDILSIGRGHRADIWELRYPTTSHVVDQSDIHAVDERVLTDGTIARPLLTADLVAVSEKITRCGIRSVAVCLLHATANHAHELAVRDWLRQRHSDVQVSMSHEVAPEVGEFERFSSTVVNAYVATTVGEYLGRVTDGLERRGYRHPLMVMRSSGGVTSADLAQQRPMQTLLSGPAGGVIGAEAIARGLNCRHLLALDMGGTSLDASVIVDQRLAVRADLEIDGIPVLMPVVDLVTVSAGGGSVAWARHGALHVGPHSAGSTPGPACYGLGGTQPTVTDANVLLGRLGHAGLANDALTLDHDAAKTAFEPLAADVGMTPLAAAQSVIDITDARMADALRTLTVRRGYDPRDFTILAFGGAGPLHAAALADELGVSSVLVPPAAGVFSAWGMLHAPIRHDISKAFLADADGLDDAALRDVHEGLWAQARQLLAADAADPAGSTYVFSADMRYIGQQFSITVSLPLGSPITEWQRSFRQQYQRAHGTVAGDPSAEFVNVRLTAAGPPPPQHAGLEQHTTQQARDGKIVHNGEVLQAVICDRSALDSTVKGPAVICDPGSTIYVPPQWSAANAAMGTVRLTRI